MSFSYNTTSGAAIPSGCILTWSGTAATIPAGFVVCDGTNGTPDLRDKFIWGSGTDSGLPLTTGGSTSHYHTVVVDPDSTNVVYDDIVSGSTTISTGEHAHNGQTDNEYHIPPYMALCFIMKV